jgi:hypothetical protein
MFKSGRTSVTDEELSGCLSILTIEANTKQICALILGNRRVTIDEVLMQWFRL